MTEMTPETSPFNNKGPEKNNVNPGSEKITESIIGSSALRLESDILENISEEQNRDAQIGEIEKSIRPKNILPFTNTDAGVQRAPRGVVGPVGNQGREASGGDRTGGEKKKGRGVRILAGAIAGVVATAGLGYGIFKDKIDSFFGGGVDPNSLPPGQTVSASGEMPSQSENIESPTPSTEVTPEVTQSPSPEEIEIVKFNQNIQDFINKTGEYSDEVMNEKLMSYYGEKLALGWIMESATGLIDFQGDLIGYIKSGDYIIMAIGFNGADGKNHVKPMAIPISFFNNPNNQSNKFPFQFIKNQEWNTETHRSIEYENSLEGIMGRLDKVKNSPVVLSVWDGVLDKNIEDAKNFFGNGSAVYFDELKKAGTLVNGLMSEVVVSSNEDILGDKTKYSLDSNISIPDIESIDDLKNIDISTVPLVSMMSSNLW